MPATILPFERRDPSSPVAVRSDQAVPDPPPAPALHALAVPASRLTPRSIAHRWAMLSYLTRHDTRRDAPDLVR